MLKIALLEDNNEDLFNLKKCVNRYFMEKSIDIELHCFSSSKEFLLSTDKYNLVYLDIEMPEANGMEVAYRLNESSNPPYIIFVTNLAQYAIEGYSVNAISYILKPLIYEDFSLKMKRVISRLNLMGAITSINAVDGVRPLRLQDIVYIEVQGHYLTYYTDKDAFKTRNTMYQVEKELSAYSFVRISQCHLVNINCISSLKTEAVVLNNGKELKITRSFKKEAVEKIRGVMKCSN